MMMLRETDLSGEVLRPGDEGYDDAARVFFATGRPALVVRPRDADEVADALRHAERRGLAVSVRSGGHSGLGHGTNTDGLVVDLGHLDTVEVIDADRRLVRVGGGAHWGQVAATLDPYGLGLTSGDTKDVGVGGLTLGGGIGHIARSGGLTIDNLLEAEVVLADGSIVRASADENPELFWALRGGGGNFGVVTAFTFKMQPVSMVVAGPTFWSLEDSAEVMRAYREFLPAAPRELNGWFAFVTVPPVPVFPEELHGRKMAAIVWCHTGSEEEAAAAMAPMLEAVEPVLHAAGPMPFPVLNGFFDALYPKGDQWYWRADFVRELPDAAIEQHVKFANEMRPGQSTMHMYPIDGAVHDVGSGDTAFSYRDVTWAQVIVGVDPDPANAEAIKQWTIDYWDATHPYSAGGAYVNFMMDEGQERVKATYRDNYDRLARAKAQYDPDNVFRVNQNIKPAS
jgi:FAD/FMN-containing dehydrogenase